MKKRRFKKLKALIYSGLCFFSAMTAGQEQDSVRIIDLRGVTINALAMPASKFEFPAAVSTLSASQLALADQSIIASGLNSMPGVFMHTGALNTNRITIRGVGSRTPFSTNKIRAFFGQIPLTDGGGETSIEDLDLSIIESVEVQKGPNAVHFGAGLGGSIQITPRVHQNEFWLQSGVGSFGLMRTGAGLATSDDDTEFRFGFFQQHADGYRENNEVDRVNYFLNWKKKTQKGDFGFLVLHTDQRAEIPSSLGISDFESEPSKAAFAWGQAKGYEDYSRTMVGFQSEMVVSGSSKFQYALFAFGRNNYEPRPFNILKESVVGTGARMKWIQSGQKLEWGWLLETFSDRYRFDTFQNLYQQFPNQGSVRGARLSSQSEWRSFSNFSAFGKYQIGKTTFAEAGFNLNKTTYFFNSKQDKNTFDLLVSPKISVVHGISNNLNIYATVSHGFTPPSLDETLDESGGFNRSIQPETGWNRELGLKGNYRFLTFTLAGYSMNIRNLLITRRTAEDVTFGLNAGSTIHNGFELEMDALIFSKGKNQITLSGAYSLNDYVFDDFNDENGDYSGNELTGVPRNQLSWSVHEKWDFIRTGFEFQFFDEMPITDDNTLYSESYQLMSTYVGFEFDWDRWSMSSNFRLNNLLDKKYASMLNINAMAFGGGEPRYYYPGLPRNWQLSFRINYKL